MTHFSSAFLSFPTWDPPFINPVHSHSVPLELVLILIFQYFGHYAALDFIRTIIHVVYSLNS